jgi:hypothetical protein
MAVVDGELVLQLREVPDLHRALGSPVAAIEAEDERIAVGERGQGVRPAAMVGKLEVREPAADDEITTHVRRLRTSV